MSGRCPGGMGHVVGTDGGCTALCSTGRYQVAKQHRASLRERWQMASQITRVIGWGHWRLHKVTFLMVLKPNCQAAYHQRVTPTDRARSDSQLPTDDARTAAP